ncbi:hypothetical protein BDZ97DRAFT_1759740 [Flammula alnicola]|nr:hypothetical protein BDZ97DRAFT_1759740 [Flammula alnicola]
MADILNVFADLSIRKTEDGIVKQEQWKMSLEGSRSLRSGLRIRIYKKGLGHMAPVQEGVVGKVVKRERRWLEFNIIPNNSEVQTAMVTLLAPFEWLGQFSHGVACVGYVLFNHTIKRRKIDSLVGALGNLVVGRALYPGKGKWSGFAKNWQEGPWFQARNAEDKIRMSLGQRGQMQRQGRS